MSTDEHKERFKQNTITRANEARVVRKIVFFVITFLLLYFAITIFLGYSYVKSALGAVEPESTETVELEIPLGSSTSEIANILEENGIIKDKRIFRFYIKFKNESDFQAGNYTLSPNMTLKETIAELQTGKLVEEPIDRVTIP